MASGQTKNRKVGFYFYTVVARLFRLYLHGTWQTAKVFFLYFGDFVDLLLSVILCMWNFTVKFLFMISIIGVYLEGCILLHGDLPYMTHLV